MVAILYQADWHEALVFLVGILTRMTLILLSCCCIARLLPRHAALRHSVLLAGLLSVLAMPILVVSVFALHLPRMTFQLPVATSVQLQQLDYVSWAEPDNNSFLQTPSDSPGNISVPLGPAVVEDAVPSADTSKVSSSTLTNDYWALWLAAFVSVWAIGAVLRAFGLLRSLKHLRHLVKDASEAEYHQLQTLVDEFRMRVGFKRGIVILCSAKAKNPLAVGLVRSCIVLPEGFTDGLSSIELKAVLCHEVAHLKRRDHIVLFLQEILATVLWWHPVVFLFNQDLTRAREEVCDNYVLKTVDAETYGETLLKITRFLYPMKQTIGATALWGSRWTLENRVSSILDARRSVMTSLNLKTSATITTLCLGISLALATTALSLAQESVDSSDNASDPVSILQAAEPKSEGNGGQAAAQADEQAPTLQQIIKSFRRNESLITDIKGSFQLTTRNARVSDVLIRSKVSWFRQAGKKLFEQIEDESDPTRRILQDDLKTLSQADTGYVSSYSFQWAARGEKRWFHRELGKVDGVPWSEEITFDGRKTYWNQIGQNRATVWDGWISDRWPLPDDCGNAVNGVPMSEFLTRNMQRCMQPMSGEYKGRRVYVVEVQGLPERSHKKDWTKKQVKLRLWLDPRNKLMPVKIELGNIIHLPGGSSYESFPHYVIEPLELLATVNGAWFVKKAKITQLAAWPWTVIQGDREQVLTETVLEAHDLVINQGISNKRFQTRLAPGTWVIDMLTGETYRQSESDKERSPNQR